MTRFQQKIKERLLYFGGDWASTVLSISGIVVGLIFSLTRLKGVMYEPYAWRSAESAKMVEDFYYRGIDILHPSVGWLGLFRMQAFEFPLPYVIITYLYRILGFDPIWGKLFFFLFFPFCCVYFYRLARQYTHASWAALALGCLCVFPLTVFYSISYQVDFMVLTAVLGSTWHFLRYLNSGKTGQLFAFGGWFWLAASEKAPYFLVVVPFLVWQILKDFNLPRLAWAGVAALPGLATFLWWVKHSAWIDAQKPDSSIIPGGMLHPDWNKWYYGTWEDRFDVDKWLWMEQHTLHAFGWVALVMAVCALVWVIATRNVFAILISLGYILLACTLFNLLFIHDYYHIPGVVAMALLCGYAVDKLVHASIPVSVAVFASLIGACIVSINTNYFLREESLEEIAHYVESVTQKDDVVLFVHENTGFSDPRLEYHSHRYGMNVRPGEVNPHNLEEARKFGVTVVATINVGPFQLPETPVSSSKTLTEHRHEVIVYRLPPNPHPELKYYQ